VTQTIDDVEALTRLVSQAEKAIEREIGEAKAAATSVRNNRAEASELDDAVLALEQVIAILNSFADERQRQIQSSIEQLVTYGLHTIFEQNLSFHILQSEKARRVETRFVVRSQTPDGTLTETPILDSRGGGIAAVAGFLLRLIVMLLRKDTRHFLLLDETFAMVSNEYEPKLIEFIRQLVDKTDAQLVVVTHKAQEAWIENADKAYQFSLLPSGKTKIAEVTDSVH
jgi:ABC-type iron transport system FetAB ATPase subunit